MSIFLPNYPNFLLLADQGNFIPVYTEIVADLDTPVAAWYRLCAQEPYSFLLESVEAGEYLGRYSLLGGNPLWRLESRGSHTVQTWRDGTTKHFTGNPFSHLAHCLSAITPVHLPELPPSLAGLVGFWGYELIPWIEPRVPIHPKGSDDLPDGIWLQMDSLIVFDQVKRKIWVIAYADTRSMAPQRAYEEACAKVSELVTKLHNPLDRCHSLVQFNSSGKILEYTSNFSKADFCRSVEQAKQHIRDGDIFQVVLSQRLSTSFTGDPFALYRSLRLINPSPYMAYLHFDRWQLIGSSPEVMVKVENSSSCKTALVRPIAGTRKRGSTSAEDRALGEELLTDPKEVAEHVMLVDLGRNDLGRVCQSGTVIVDELMTIERYSHVMHIVSNVIGKVEPHCSPWQVLQSTFPAGTVSGAPKIRAMAIIHNLEGSHRGPYAGAYGYYDFAGQLNTAITIRTLIVQNGTVTVQAGAGIVADSNPEDEYQETLNKAKGMLEAIRYLSNP